MRAGARRFNAVLAVAIRAAALLVAALLAAALLAVALLAAALLAVALLAVALLAAALLASDGDGRERQHGGAVRPVSSQRGRPCYFRDRFTFPHSPMFFPFPSLLNLPSQIPCRLFPLACPCHAEPRSLVDRAAGTRQSVEKHVWEGAEGRGETPTGAEVRVGIRLRTEERTFLPAQARDLIRPKQHHGRHVSGATQFYARQSLSA
ncbi:hypothetical protein CLOM_g3417 [Closterium sp. NIES-68]|nr:hypothetical protein CLOM_g3417 [Closterium sp. NIES-68]